MFLFDWVKALSSDISLVHFCRPLLLQWGLPSLAVGLMDVSVRFDDRFGFRGGRSKSTAHARRPFIAQLGSSTFAIVLMIATVRLDGGFCFSRRRSTFHRFRHFPSHGRIRHTARRFGSKLVFISSHVKSRVTATAAPHCWLLHNGR